MNLLKEIKMNVIDTDLLQEGDKVIVTNIDDNGYKQTLYGFVSQIDSDGIHIDVDEGDWMSDIYITVTDLELEFAIIDKCFV